MWNIRHLNCSPRVFTIYSKHGRGRLSSELCVQRQAHFLDVTRPLPCENFAFSETFHGTACSEGTSQTTAHLRPAGRTTSQINSRFAVVVQILPKSNSGKVNSQIALARCWFCLTFKRPHIDAPVLQHARHSQTRTSFWACAIAAQLPAWFPQ